MLGIGNMGGDDGYGNVDRLIKTPVFLPKSNVEIERKLWQEKGVVEKWRCWAASGRCWAGQEQRDREEEEETESGKRRKERS